MPSIDYGRSSYQRGRGDLPELPVINMFVEQAQTEKRAAILQSRAGLEDRSADMGNGPIKQLFRRDNVLNSALFGIGGSTLYRETSALGSVDGSGPWSIAGYENFLFAAGGKSLWGYDGSTLSSIPFPDGADVLKVLVGVARLIAIRKDTQQYYFSDVLGTEIDALNFTSAENQPDRLLDALFVDGLLILFGAETVEFHASSGNADLPFRPLQARVIEKGIKATGCAAAVGSSFVWVTNENRMCFRNEETVVSNPGLEARIEASTECQLFPFVLEGREFVALRMDDETQVWNRETNTWSEFVSYGYDNWLPQCFSSGVFGSSVDGRVLAWSRDNEDLGGLLERRWRGGFPIDGGGVVIDNLTARCNVGQAPDLTGVYANPQIEMRLSDDAGRTWGGWEAESLGEQGQYRTDPEWRALGMASYPAFFAEFRVTDPVDVRVSDVLVNEPMGGR